MDRMLRTLRETKPAPGHDPVLYPGLSEHEEEQQRKANGIPLHREVVQSFDDITSELSLPQLRRM
jgi:LDH2 family malate/lactate/ureidoglycolate dehydrogenase